MCFSFWGLVGAVLTEVKSTTMPMVGAEPLGMIPTDDGVNC